MVKKPGIFPTFFISGFECSTFLWKDRKRRNLVAETQHDLQVHKDYEILRSLGIAVAREGVPWPLVDNSGNMIFPASTLCWTPCGNTRFYPSGIFAIMVIRTTWILLPMPLSSALRLIAVP